MLKMVLKRQQAQITANLILPAQSSMSYHTMENKLGTMTKPNQVLARRATEAHFALVNAPVRSFNFNFHSKTDNKEKPVDKTYEKSFEELLGKQSSANGMSMEEQIKQKQKETAEAQERFEKEKAQFDAKKQQEFEDLLSGKKKSRDEMSLQDLFKDFYSKAKDTDPKAYMNSARSSLNSFSGLLEKKRQAAQQKKQEGAAATKATEEIKEQDQAKTPQEEAQQKAQEAAP